MMPRSSVYVLVAMTVLGTSTVKAGDDPPTIANVIELKRCEIEYRRSSLVGVGHMGTTTTTILQDCMVRPGDRVTAGQILGRVMDRDIQAEFELRKAQADNDIEVKVNEARYALASTKLKRTETLQKRTYMSAEMLNEHELEANTAKLEIDMSKYRRRLAEIQRLQAEAMLHARQYISPHDGVVVEVLKEQGEAVSAIEPIFRVVEVDWLKVTGHLNLPDYWRVRKGQEVRIYPDIDGDDLPIEREVFTGHIIFVDSRIDPNTRTCKVVAEVANRELLLASGLEARMEILLGNSWAERPTAEQKSSSPRPVEPERMSRVERPRVVPEASERKP